MTGPGAAPGSGLHDVERALDRLREAGGRVTRAKRSIVELFYATEVSLTAEQVLERIGSVDETTVYRTLVQLERAGVIDHVHLGHGPATYRRAGATTVPVVCGRCGLVVEVPAAELDGVADLVLRDHGIRLDLAHFALTGTCVMCLEHEP